MQDVLQALCNTHLVDLHVSDLLNDQLPSRYDYTSLYDLLVFRRLTASNGADPAPKGDKPTLSHGGPTVLRRVDTRPVGFAVFDRVLLSVHPEDAAVRDAFCSKLLSAALPDDIGRVAVPALDVRSVSARILQARQT